MRQWVLGERIEEVLYAPEIPEARRAEGEAVESKTTVPFRLRLAPNPATSEVQFQTSLPTAGSLEIWEISGRKITELPVPAGEHRQSWSCQGISSGMYLCRLTSAATAPITHRLIILE